MAGGSRETFAIYGMARQADITPLTKQTARITRKQTASYTGRKLSLQTCHIRETCASYPARIRATPMTHALHVRDAPTAEAGGYAEVRGSATGGKWGSEKLVDTTAWLDADEAEQVRMWRDEVCGCGGRAGYGCGMAGMRMWRQVRGCGEAGCAVWRQVCGCGGRCADNMAGMRMRR